MILVTGADGSIGKALLDAIPAARGIDLADWDIRFPRPASNEVEPQPRLVYHLAAAKDAPEGERDPGKVLSINAVGTENVLARWPSAQVVMASTCKACDPETAYGASKLIAERLVLNAGGSVARFHNVVETRGNVFQTWKGIPGGFSLPVAPCHRYFIHVADAVRLLLEVPLLPAGRYLLHPGRSQWMPDIVREYHPGRRWHYIEPRRGDRLREPLIASHEAMTETGIPGIMKVTSPHD